MNNITIKEKFCLDFVLDKNKDLIGILDNGEVLSVKNTNKIYGVITLVYEWKDFINDYLDDEELKRIEREVLNILEFNN